MSLMERWEHRLGGLVEGLFARTFKGPMHPIEIARQLGRAMDAHSMVSVSRTYAPNTYFVQLHTRDVELLSGLLEILQGELETYLEEHASERRYTLVGAVRVELEGSDEVDPGGLQATTSFTKSVGIDTAVRRGAALAGPRAQEAARDGQMQQRSGDVEDAETPPEVAAEQGKTRVFRFRRPDQPVLVVMQGPDAGVRFPLVADAATVGRREGCEVRIGDPSISREHFRIERAGDGFKLTDLGSTNGTFVNDRPVKEHHLRGGDTIRIGNTELQFQAGAA